MLSVNPEQFLIPAVAQERVWSLVSPSPVFLVPKHSFGMLLDERHTKPERRAADR